MAKPFKQTQLRRKFGIFALALLLLVVSASLVFAATAEATKSDPLQLRPAIVVDGANITFGDMFENAESLKDKIIASAPLPGRRLNLNPLGVARIAAANGRVWRNISGLKRILVKRSGRKLTQQELSQLILDELQQSGTQHQYELSLNVGSAGIFVPSMGTSMPMLQDVNFDPRTGRFVASLVAYTDADPVILRGRAWQTVKVPTLNRTIHGGDLIMQEDVGWSDVRADRMGLYPVLDPAHIVGKIAARTLVAHRVLRARDVQIPHAVIKGEMILITYELPGLRLTARGKVLANAGTGEVVRAVNLSSSRTIDVTIIGPGQAVATGTHNLAGWKS